MDSKSMELGKMDTSRRSQPTYLAWSIFNTFCCCLPLGVAAIIYSCRADNANTLGDVGKAQESSRTAKNLNIASLVLGIIGLILMIVMLVFQKIIELHYSTPEVMKTSCAFKIK